MKKAAIFWSGGKDCAYSLYLAKEKYEVKYLVTTVNRETERVTMHGVSQELITRQSIQSGIPVKWMTMEGSSNEEYEQAFLKTCKELRTENIEVLVFGDIFLEDLKAYRDNLLQKAGMRSLYPLWGQNTNEIRHKLKELGFRTTVCCVDADHFTPGDTGKDLDDLEEGKYDPCGENGEYHTFCYEGPVFKDPIKFRCGKIVEKEYLQGKVPKKFYFRELY